MTIHHQQLCIFVIFFFKNECQLLLFFYYSHISYIILQARMKIYSLCFVKISSLFDVNQQKKNCFNQAIVDQENIIHLSSFIK